MRERTGAAYGAGSTSDSRHQVRVAELNNCGKPSSRSPNKISDMDIVQTPRKSTDTLTRAAGCHNPTQPPFPIINAVTAAADQAIGGGFLPPIIGDSKSINPQSWRFLNASERVAFLQRWLMYAEIKYKAPIDRWPEAFAQEWSMLKHGSSTSQCLIAAKQKVFAGRVAPSCIGQSAHEKGRGRQKIKLLKGRKRKDNCKLMLTKLLLPRHQVTLSHRVMEGDLPNNAEQWRAIYVQTYHITGIVTRACASLQCQIDAAVAGITPNSINNK
jgi:hypothetical protein